MRCQQTFQNKIFVDITQQYFLNFPANDLNFHSRWGWWDWTKAIFLNLLYFTKLENLCRYSVHLLLVLPPCRIQRVEVSKQALEAAEKAEIRVSANKRYTREVLIFAVVWPLLYNAYFSSHSLGKHTSASMRLLCFHC